jgi:hypothetical protein
MTVLWDVALGHLIEMYRRFQGDRIDDGGSKHIWNVDKFLSDNTGRYPKRQPYLCSSLLWHEISPEEQNFELRNAKRQSSNLLNYNSYKKPSHFVRSEAVDSLSPWQRDIHGGF